MGIAIPDIRENLYSGDKDIIRRYFWNSSTDPIIPKSAGYYIGYLLVKELSNKYTLEELIQLKEEDFLPEFEDILKAGSDARNF